MNIVYPAPNSQAGMLLSFLLVCCIFGLILIIKNIIIRLNKKWIEAQK